MSDDASAALDREHGGRPATWVLRAMALEAERASSGPASNDSDGLAECAALLSRFWSLDDETPPEASAAVATPGAGASAAADMPALPARLGRFAIRRMLGRGGFGLVFLVFDERLAREAALKIPRPEILVWPEARERFLREAQAAASLDHPGIVAIYETGTIGPVGYILSAYCPGPTLATWLAERPAGTESRPAAEIVARVADAAHHAHVRGILHRDIKPSNVLLEPVADAPAGSLAVRPRLSDFGLAKRLDEAGDATRRGDLLGTPRYMAPEQAAGDYANVGVQSDVHALGILMYELLTGATPFEGSSDDDILHKIRTQEPATAIFRERRVPRDLVTICLKCLQKPQAARYSSAKELADDLRRFLAGEVVLARPVSQAERLRRWCARNRAVAALGAAVLLALVGGTAVSTYYALSAGARAREAQRSLAQARAAVKDSFVMLSEQLLLDEPGMQPLRKDLLKTSLAYFQDFAREHANEPELRLELAQAHLLAADIQALIGEHVEADAEFDQALRIYRALLREDPTSVEYRRALAGGYLSYAIWQNAMRRSQQTEPLMRAAIEIREALVRENPHSAVLQSELAAGYYSLGDLHVHMYRRPQAEPLLRQAQAIRERLVAAHPGVESYRNDLGFSDHTLAVFLAEERRSEEAESLFRRAVELREALADESTAVGAPHRELAQSYKHFAVLQAARGRHAEAIDLFGKAIAAHERLARESPAVVRYQRDLADGHNQFADLQSSLGNDDEAEASYRRAIEVQEHLTTADPSIAGYQFQLSQYCIGMTKFLSSRGRIDEGGPWYAKSLAAREMLVHNEPIKHKNWFLLGYTYLYGAEYPEVSTAVGDAESLYRRAIEALERVVRGEPKALGNHTHLQEAYGGLAIARERGGRSEETVDELRDAIARAATSPGTADSRAADWIPAALHARIGLQRALAGADWNLVAPELARARELAPKQVVVLLVCGDAAALCGAWREAADCYSRAHDLSGQPWWTGRYCARMHLAAGDEIAYRQVCASLVARYRNSASAREASLIAMTCALGSGAMDDLASVVALARQGAGAEVRDPTAQAALGAVLVRAGSPAEAAPVLERACSLLDDACSRRRDRLDEYRAMRLYTAVFLAHAYRDLGRARELDAARGQIEQQITELRAERMPSSAQILPWSFRLATELAERMLADLAPGA